MRGNTPADSLRRFAAQRGTPPRTGETTLRISDHVEGARVPLVARTKDDVLRELVSLLGKPDEATEAILAAVRAREQRMSTGIGRGIAIPHGKSEAVTGLEIACGVADAPIDYGALDRKPARLFFLLASSPDRAEAHLEALGRIARMLADDSVADELIAATSSSEFLAALRRAEEAVE